MIRCFQKFLKDETGSVVAPEMLIIIAGVVMASGIILRSVSTPLKVLHEGTTKNITNISRGF